MSLKIQIYAIYMCNLYIFKNTDMQFICAIYINTINYITVLIMSDFTFIRY